MNTTTKQETAGSMLGVQGRFFGVVTADNGIIRNQKFISERRVIEGWGAGATIYVEVRFDDQCNNGHESFAITAEIRRPGRRDCEACGCLHDEIAKVFPELAPLIKWHLVSTNSPMHYVANTLYQASDRDHNGKARDFDGARACGVWHEATDEELSVPRAELEAALKARLPALMAEFKAAMVGAGFVYPARVKGE